MSDDRTNATPLTFRPATNDDWPRVRAITEHTWDDGDYINPVVWQHWLADEEGELTVAVKDGEVVGLCKLTSFGPAEWWLEGIRVDETQRGAGIAAALTEHMLALFDREAKGIVRLSTYSENEPSRRLAERFGFRNIMGYVAHAAPAEERPFGGFKKLQAQNVELATQYLRRSPMYRLNRFMEHRWKLKYLTHDRLGALLADPDAWVLGWRQAGRLDGLAIISREVPPGFEPRPDVMAISYLDAPDDTTLGAMLGALRGLAARFGHEKAAWKMPVGMGLTRAVEVAGYADEWEGDGTMLLFERPIRR